MERTQERFKELLKLFIHSQDIYQYHPLRLDGSIRLLELNPAASPQEALYCRLKEAKLSSGIQYEALSYVWGEDEFPETLNLPGGHLKITSNLASALRSLRLPVKSRVLWVDAICINQIDDVEKRSQVLGMASVYRNASSVLAWLGEDSENSPVDIPVIVALSRKAQELGLGKSLEGQRDILMAWIYNPFTQGAKPPLSQAVDFNTAAAQANFVLIYESAWFTRMWIVQEALLATRLTLFRGSKSLEWEDFERVMILIHAIRATVPVKIRNDHAFSRDAWSLVVARNHYRSSSERPENPRLEFMYYVNQLKRRDCKDERDRLYALKSLLPESIEVTIAPDYEKTVVEVFTDLAIQQLQVGHIEILYQAGLCRNAKAILQNIRPNISGFPIFEPLPTWAPDYRKDNTYVCWPPYFGDETSFLPDTSISPTLKFSPDNENPRRLITNVTLVDGIKTTLPLPFLYVEELLDDHAKIFFVIRHILKQSYDNFIADHASRPYPTGEDLSSVFAHAILGGGTSEGYKTSFTPFGPNSEVPSPLQVWQAYEEQCLSEDGLLFQQMRQEIESTESAGRINGIRKEWYLNSSHDEGAWELTNYLKFVLRFHVLFTTRRGYIGLAPPGTVTGTDIIVFIDGLKVPFVLRGVGGQNWKVVGPCYVRGLMDAEAARTDERLGARLTLNLI